MWRGDGRRKCELKTFFKELSDTKNDIYYKFFQLTFSTGPLIKNTFGYQKIKKIRGMVKNL